jgi:uncharacterized membrane protein YfcA
MNLIEFSVVLGAVAAGAGFLGSLTGLGGGVVLTPVLTLLFGVDIRYAIGATLVSVIATSSGAAAAYVREGFSNIRIGMFLEIATTTGAIVGAFLAAMLPTSALGVLFGLLLLYSAWQSTVSKPDIALTGGTDPLAVRLRMNSVLPTPEGPKPYGVHRVKLGFVMMLGAGIVSGLLGIGSGALKVIAMDQAMRIPFKISTATSNFMIGVTAAASAGVYLHRGYIDPTLAAPIVLGVLAGSLAGARLLPHAKTKALRRLFAVVVTALAVEMLYNGLKGRI